jgi:hypothetical protein
VLLGLFPFIQHPRLLASAKKDPRASNEEEQVSETMKGDILALFNIQSNGADELLFVLIVAGMDDALEPIRPLRDYPFR